uniref:ZAD domain-containing protein n=1 Tax=Anopheles dirus TaxID=7168 RepID=A0A182NT27_9DIPT
SDSDPQLDGVSFDGEAQLHPCCYVCHFPATQDEFYPLFAEPDEGVFTPAKILCDILDIEVIPDLCHSQIICVNCNMLCIEFQSLLQRMEAIRIEMTMAYNQTVMKLTGLTEKDLKEGIVEVEDTEANLDSELQSFNKELMSMEEVFRMEGLVPDSIEVDPSTEQMDSALPKLGIVWQSEVDGTEVSTNSLINSSALVDATECGTVKETHEPEIMHVREDNLTEPLEPSGIVDASEHELSTEDTLERFISESNDGIVEVTGEDGTALYCIYDDVIETYSDSEEPTDITMLNCINEDGALDCDEVIIDSTSQASKAGQTEIEETVTPPSQTHGNGNSADSALVSTTPTSDGATLQP